MISKNARFQSDKQEVNLSNDSITRVLQSVLSNPIVNGQLATRRDTDSTSPTAGELITNYSIVTGTDNAITHGLNRPITGWFIVRKRAQATIWDTQDTSVTSDTKNTTLYLRTSANVTIDVYVF